MPSLSINGRIQRLEKQVAPSIKEISKVINRAIYNRPVWFAFVASHRGETTPIDDQMIREFWQDESWQGAKLALDARWPRSLWEPAFWDNSYKAKGYKDYLDYYASELWFMDAEPESAAQTIFGRKTEVALEKHDRQVYGRFLSLPADEQTSWREMAKEDQTAQYVSGDHSPKVKVIVDRFFAVYRKLVEEKKLAA